MKNLTIYLMKLALAVALPSGLGLIAHLGGMSHALANTNLETNGDRYYYFPLVVVSSESGSGPFEFRTVNTVGSGSVVVEPDKVAYDFGETVILTATADPGWTFSGWSGDLTGSTNPESLVMDADKTVTATFSIADTGPFVDVWYGNHQTFGQLGVPQNWINILGNVSDPDGVIGLSYTLNGGVSRSLSIGPDTRRLADPGDFNIDLDYTELTNGLNDVVIRAEDSLGNVTIESVTVEFVGGNVWPLPYTIDWSTITNVQDTVQVVDGLWSLVPGGLRTMQVDYDRVLDIGDLTWDDYEVTVPITVHAIDPDGYNWPSVSPGFGITFRWRGHTDNPVICSQPHCGWQPYGANAWYDIGQGGPLRLDGYRDFSVSMNVGDTFYWKMRVETVTGVGPLYSLKVWESGQPEPAEWNVASQRGFSDVSNGSLIVIAHHVDLTVGDMMITPVLPLATEALLGSIVSNSLVAATPGKASNPESK